MQGIKPVIEVTDAAIEQFKKLLSTSGPMKTTIRISPSGGCCYYVYDHNITEGGETGDILIEKANLKIYIDPAVFEGFPQAALDYRDGWLFIVNERGNSLAKGLLNRYKRRKTMTMTDELKDKFNNLTDEEKMAFIKSVIPSFCEVFSKNPHKMMTEMIPFCGEMMKSCNMDVQGMMKMMGMMGAMGNSPK